MVYLDPEGLCEGSYSSESSSDFVEPSVCPVVDPDVITLIDPAEYAYDWWNPMTPTGIKCKKPCKWHNKEDITYQYREGGCYRAEISLPTDVLSGGLGTILAIYHEICPPSVTLCDGHIVNGFACQCTLRLKRKCERKCCDQIWGKFTRHKEVRKTLVAYDVGVYSYGGLTCGCNPNVLIPSPYALRKELNKLLSCEQ